MILHITTKREWEDAVKNGEYRTPSLEKEGFIHCSTDRQAMHVANAFYRNVPDLILLVIDESNLMPEIKWEPPAGPPASGISDSDKFPHVFGPINLNAVATILELEPDSVSGNYTLPTLPTGF
jgi:uncharacterized protein (DUF952 family)